MTGDDRSLADEAAEAVQGEAKNWLRSAVVGGVLGALVLGGFGLHHFGTHGLMIGLAAGAVMGALAGWFLYLHLWVSTGLLAACLLTSCGGPQGPPTRDWLTEQPEPGASADTVEAEFGAPTERDRELIYTLYDNVSLTAHFGEDGRCEYTASQYGEGEWPAGTPQPDFDAAAWRGTPPPERGNLVRQIMDQRALDGLPVTRVVELLGDPDYEVGYWTYEDGDRSLLVLVDKNRGVVRCLRSGS